LGFISGVMGVTLGACCAMAMAVVAMTALRAIVKFARMLRMRVDNTALAAWAVWLAAIAAPAAAQTVQVRYEHEFGAYRYRFENPSSFDTPQLVPHFFEQKYDTNKDWLVGRVAYGQTLHATTEAAIARDAERSATGLRHVLRCAR
jgi:hypothetical protein